MTYEEFEEQQRQIRDKAKADRKARLEAERARGPLTVGKLIAFLLESDVDPDAQIMLEGCDCEALAYDVENGNPIYLLRSTRS